MGDDWKRGLLGDIVELKRGYDLPQAERRPGTVPIVSSSGITDFHEIAQSKAPGVVTGRYGTIGQVFYIETDFWPLNTTLYVRNFKGNDPRFISYFLKTLDFQAYSDKAAVPGINRNHLHMAHVHYPSSTSEQRAIAHVLGSLDDKIELNRRANKTVEEIARTLFRAWFVDFEPVRARVAGRPPVSCDVATAAFFPDRLIDSELGEIPEGWEHFTIHELGTLEKSTITPGATPDTMFRLYSLPAFDSGQLPELVSGTSIKSGKSRVPANCVLISKLNPRIPRIWLVHDLPTAPAICSTEFLVLTPKKTTVSPDWIYLQLGEEGFIREFATRVTGTSGSHQRVRPVDLLSMPTIYPNQDVAKRFDRIVSPMLELVEKNRIESRSLAELRDTLLPKLLSGELRVPVAEEMVEASL